jgi:chemotaxis protein histidine kinase CheA
MVDFDKFEKNVKSKYGNQEFPFDEQNWEKAAKMIDASRQGKNRGGIFLLSAIALLCTTGLVYYFGFSDNKALEKNNLAINQVVTANETTVANNESTSENQTESVNSNNINTNSKVSENNSTETTNEVAKTNSSNLTSNSNNKTSLNSKKSTAVATTEKAIAENNTNPTTENNTEETTTTTSSNPDIKSTSTNPQSKKPTQAKSPAKTATPPVLGNTSSAQNTAKPSSTIPNTTTSESGNTNKLGEVESTEENTPVAETPTKINPTATDTSTTIVAATVKPTKSNVVDSVPPMRKSRADSLAAMLPKGDGVSYATNVKEKHNAKNILFMEAGATYLLGWNNGGNNEAGGFNLLAGVNFQHYFSNTISAQIGVQYSTISNLTNTSHTISTVKYDFGMEQDITAIKYQKLHYLVAPVKVVFNAGDKNFIGVGCNVGYLLNSDSKKENYKTNSNDPNATKNGLTSTKESGYVQGFNPFDIQVSASYRRKLYKGLSANAEFIYGLTDTKNNSFFKSNNFDRTVGFKLTLCYDLFKK